jgi:hypothetical protein
MKTIHFKNSTSVEVSEEIGKIIIHNLTNGRREYQSFTDENNKFAILINLREILYII